MNTTLNILRSDPTLLELENYERFRATMYTNIPTLENKSICPNCEASMQQYSPTFDYFDAKLLQAMAQAIKHRMTKGVLFTEANKVNIQKECEADYTTKSRQAKCRQLGLIAKFMVDGVHKESRWSITRRGWSVLRGDSIPKQVTVFRNKIIERGDTMTTMKDALYTKQERFEPEDWYEVAGLSEGILL